ncbi:cation transporting ATPase C-terminal domain-containing protein [Congregibacter sp.]|uniref:cation transporting ATPase C-terminal domain-containing protein n=1 Tax=Congregibacter sp. TaxID=2744308 RepID=UPI003F6B7F3B
MIHMRGMRHEDTSLWLLGGIVLSVLIRLIPTMVPEAAALFRTAPFPMVWWPVILLCFLPSLIGIESDKFLRSSLSAEPV